VHQPQASPAAVSTQQAAVAAIGQSDVLQLSGTHKAIRLIPVAEATTVSEPSSLGPAPRESKPSLLWE